MTDHTNPPPACRCRHPHVLHDRPGLAPQCVSPGCSCLQYRPLGHLTVELAAARTAPRAAHTPPSPLPSPVKFQPAAEPELEIVTETNEVNKTADRLHSEPDNATQLASVDVHFLLREAKTRTPRIRARAGKIEQLLAELRDLVQADAEAAAARAEISQLEQRLAVAKAKLRPAKKAAKAAPERATGIYQCPDCPREFATNNALGAHRSRSHGFRKAVAS